MVFFLRTLHAFMLQDSQGLNIQSLESWLVSMGATKDKNNPSMWYLNLTSWNAIINFEQEDLSVIWDFNGQLTKRLFSYCINLEDVEKNWPKNFSTENVNT